MNNIIWWQGRVKDINDPDRAGKVQVEIFNFYELPPNGRTRQEDLPWCIPLLPTTSPSLNGVGDTPQFVVDTRVFGFFVDGQHAGMISKPYIFGTMPIAPGEENKNSIPMLARGKDTVEENKVSDVVPDSSYKAQYPLNRVIQSRKGHTIELDDTDGAERIRIRHGTNNAYIEIAPSGAVTITTSDNIVVAAGGTADIHAKGDALIKADGNMNITAEKNLEITSRGDLVLGAAGRIVHQGVTGISLVSGADTTVEGPGGLGVTEGSLFVIGDCNIGTGFTGNIIAGGLWLDFVNGVCVGGGPAR